MNTEELLEKMKEMDTESLIHELRESRRRAIDFMDAQQGFLIELRSRPPVEEKSEAAPELETPPVEEKSEAAPSPSEVEDFFISQDDLDNIIEEASNKEQATEKAVDITSSFEQDLEFTDDLSITFEEAKQAIVESQFGKISPKVDYKSSKENSDSALDQSEIDALLGGGDDVSEEDDTPEDMDMLDQSAIDNLLEGIVEEPALGGIDLEELAEVAEKEEALDQSTINDLLDHAASKEEFDVIEEVAPQEKIVYETVDRAEVMELQVQLNKARERKKIEDKKELERIKKQGRTEINVNKKKPTAEEIEERLIDSNEANALDYEIAQLKKMGKGDK